VDALIYQDTYAVAWLYARGEDAIRYPAVSLVQTGDLRISPVVRRELQCLYEIGRVTEPVVKVVDVLHGAFGLTLSDIAFESVVRAAETLSWTRDPFDRLIVAQAAINQSPLIIKDKTIHPRYPHAVLDGT
jgi:PIN domain nuclease of toxin-antitoxin system